MARYCLLMTATTATTNGNVDLVTYPPYWASPDDMTKSPGGTKRFLEADTVSVAMRLLDGNGDQLALPDDFLLTAIITPKRAAATKNASPYKFGAVATGYRRPLLVGSRSGEGSSVSTLTGFDLDGNPGPLSPLASTFNWIGFDYSECLLFHDSGPQDAQFELTISAMLTGSQQWAYDPEMDVGKRGSR